MVSVEGFVDLLPLPILEGAGVLEVAILRAVQDKKEKLFWSLLESLCATLKVISRPFGGMRRTKNFLFLQVTIGLLVRR